MAEQNYGGFWIRFLAYLVDTLIVGIGFAVIVLLLGLMGLELFSPPLIFVIVGIVYWAGMQASKRQATYGKSLVGLKVTGLGGERISIARAFAREAAKIISSLTFLIGYVIAAFTKRKQALHDLIATTLVVRTERGHVVAAAAVALLALFAPAIVIMFFGVGLIAGMMGGLAGSMLSGPEATMQIPKPAAPPAAPVAKPQVAQAPTAAPAAPPPPGAAPATPAPIPAAAKPVPVATAAPVVVAQAPEQPKPALAEPAKEPAKSAGRKPRTKPAADAPKPEALPREVAAPTPSAPAAAEPAPAAAASMAREPPTPVLVPARPMAPPSPKFNDLTTAVLYGDAYAVQQLLAIGKWPDKPDSRGITPLMVAVQLGDTTSAEALVTAGANPNRPGPGGDTAMSIARERKDAAMVRLLQRYGGK
jgi:uncharacterized RDD family membrane protein YckC